MKKALVIHHWDADGIASAALLKKHLTSKGFEVRTYTPPIGAYLVEDDVLQQHFDRIYCVDLAMPEEEFLKLLALGKLLETWRARLLACVREDGLKVQV